MSIQTITLTIQGEGPLLQHNSRLANQFDPHTKQLAALNREKKRKGADKEAILEQMAECEWRGGLYYDERNGVHMPWRCIRKSLVESARLTREGKKVERAVNSSKSAFSLIYSGPSHPDALWTDSRFIDQRPVKVGQAMITRTRPVFPEWSIEVELFFDNDMVQRDDIIRWVNDAGRFIGLGDGRSIGFGRYSLAAVDGKSVQGMAAK